MTEHGTVGVCALDHINIGTSRFIETLAFFTDALGLRAGPTPGECHDPPIAAWLYAGATPVVHLVRREEGGTDAPCAPALDHVAFACQDMLPAEARLAAAGVPFERRIFEEFGIRQLIVHDPNGIMIELGFVDEPRNNETGRGSTARGMA